MCSKGEFGYIDFIKEHFNIPTGVIGIGDDCAVMPNGETELLFSTDLLMEGIHFLRSAATPEEIGWKSLAVNLSDIAAMGGTPVASFLSIALPKDAQGEWAERFIGGYSQLSRIFDVPLLGGDTTSSLRDISINVGVIGRSPLGRSIKRDGAQVGHGVYVTGNLGDSAGGLQAILNGWEKTSEVELLIRTHLKPLPRIKEGQALMQTGMVDAMMDISDGIASDLRHILKASGVGARIYLDKIPMSDNLKAVCTAFGTDAVSLATGGGEDYELLFTAPDGIMGILDFPVYRIGEITADDTLKWIYDDRTVDLNVKGFNHF